LFIFLEFISFWMIVQANHYQNAVFLNSSNQYIGSMLQFTSNIGSYFRLGQVNNKLAQENVRLHKEINQLRQQHKKNKIEPVTDSVVVSQYNYTIAEVVNNSTHRANNYITINKGSKDGLATGMAIISPLGIVGHIKKVNRHFSNVVSVLHSKSEISAQIKKNGELGTIKWNGKSPKYVQLHNIQTYVKVQVGDTICTSGYNAVFPPRITIGTVKKVRQKPAQTMYELEIELATSFNRLDYVYAIKNIMKIEQDSLEMENFIEIDE
jgi:rod shape-determining protein MreC